MSGSLDIVDIDLSKDGDVFNQTQLRELYTNPYSCVSRKSLGLDKIYILHLDAQWQNNVMACTMSNSSVHLSSVDTLTKIDTFPVHEAPPIGVKFSPGNPNVLFTGSNNGSIRVWDVRNPRKPSKEYKDDSTGNVKPIHSFDINCEGQILCAGTEKIKKEDAHLLFWDLRSSNSLGKYSDSHEDDISNVQFHRTESNILASCSTDCLINIFDCNQAEDDDALMYSLNAGTSCGQLQWLRPINNVKSISVATHTEDVQIWTVEEASPLHSFNREQIRAALQRKKIETVYAIRCFQLENDEHPLMLAGSTTSGSGCLRLLQLNGNELKPYALLEEQGRSSQIVRCAALNPLDGSLISGGEDGIINVWKRSDGDNGQDSSALAGERKVKVEKKSKKHGKKPYMK